MLWTLKSQFQSLMAEHGRTEGHWKDFMFWSAIPRVGPGASIRIIHQMSHFFVMPCFQDLSGLPAILITLGFHSFLLLASPIKSIADAYLGHARYAGVDVTRRIATSCFIIWSYPHVSSLAGKSWKPKNHQKSPTNGGFSSHVALPKAIPNEIITHQRGVYWQRG